MTAFPVAKILATPM